MLQQAYFFHNIIRKYVVVFGRIFSDVHVQNAQGAVLNDRKVQITYSNKEKFMIQMDERQSQDNNEINLSKLLPVMGYSLTSMRPDSTSRLNPKNEYTLSSGYIYTPVPYDFTFELYVWTKSINHMFQILEQCCVFFKPNYCTTIKEVPAFGSIGYSDVDITLDDITFGNTVEFDEEGWRALESTLTFTLKGNLYPAITNQGDIEEIRIRMRNMGATEEQDQYIETLLTEYDSDTQTTTQSVIVEAGL